MSKRALEPTVDTRIPKLPDKQYARELQEYFRGYFPIPLMYKWFTLGDQVPLAKRAFSFYQPFSEKFSRNEKHTINTLPQFKKWMDTNSPIRYVESLHLNIVQISSNRSYRELVFDVDLDAYDKDNLRFCPCVGKKMCCTLCWKYVLVSMYMLPYQLKDTMGDKYSKNIVWVHSGSKGVHAWVGNIRAGLLSFEQRATILHHMAVPIKPTDTDKISFAWKGFKKIFSDCLMISSFRKLILNTLTSKVGVYVYLESQWNTEPTPTTTEEYLKHLEIAIMGTKASLVSTTHFLTFFMTPIYDEEVTIGRRHQLKCPFSVHHGTRVVSLPILESTIDTLPSPPNPNDVKNGTYDITPHISRMDTWLSSLLDDIEKYK